MSARRYWPAFAALALYLIAGLLDGMDATDREHRERARMQSAAVETAPRPAVVPVAECQTDAECAELDQARGAQP